MRTEARKRTSERSRAGARIPEIDVSILTAGRKIGALYRLVRPLDRKCRVWCATDNNDRWLVLKHGLPVSVEREFRVLSALKHPNIVAAQGRVEDEAGSFIVLEYLSGGDLVSLAGLAPECWLYQLTEVMAALEYLHCRGMVHRDLKPSNVLLDESGHVRLTDFESALPSGSEWTAAGTTEVLIRPGRGDEPVSASDDLYALAGLAHEMLYGMPPGAGARKACPEAARPLAELVDCSLEVGEPAAERDLAAFSAVVELVKSNLPDPV